MTTTERDVSTEEYLEMLECRLSLMFAKGSFECSDEVSNETEESVDDETFTPNDIPRNEGLMFRIKKNIFLCRKKLSFV